MNEISSVRLSPLLSPRTTKYVEALIREGNDFDFDRWLKRVREEEARAKKPRTAISRHEFVAAGDEYPINNQDARASNRALGARALRWPHHLAKRQTPQARLRRRLEKVHRAWGEFQASRGRDAVYSYLEEVFAIVVHFKVRRRTHRLLRQAFKFGNLPFDKNADPFSAVILSTSEDNLDNKTISKWARALRYVARTKNPDNELRRFMKKAGGINGCAARYAQRKRSNLVGKAVFLASLNGSRHG